MKKIRITALLSLLAVLFVTASGCGISGTGGGDPHSGDSDMVLPGMSCPVSSADCLPPPEGYHGQAILGPVINASVIVEKLFDNTGILCRTTSKDSRNLDSAGTFVIPDSCIDDADRLYLVTVTGGQDIDANDDGVIDGVFSIVTGSFHAIISGEQMLLDDWKVSAATEAAYRATNMGIGMMELEEATIKRILDQHSNEFLKEDISGDGLISYEDTLIWHPIKHRDVTLDYNVLIDIAMSIELSPDEMVESIELDSIIVGHINTLHPAMSVTLFNETALITTEHELHYIDVSPERPELIQTINIINAFKIVEYQSEKLTVVLAENRLLLLDHSSGIPQAAGSLELPGVYDFVKTGNNLYVYSGNSGSANVLMDNSRPETTLYKVDISDRKKPVIDASKEDLSYLALTWFDESLWALEIDKENSVFKIEFPSMSLITDEHYYLSRLDHHDLTTLYSQKVGTILGDSINYIISSAYFDGPVANLTIMTLEGYMPSTQTFSLNITDTDSIFSPVYVSDADSSDRNLPYFEYVTDSFRAVNVDPSYPLPFPKLEYVESLMDTVVVTEKYYIDISDQYPEGGIHLFTINVFDKNTNEPVLSHRLPKQEGNHFFSAAIVSDGKRLYLAADNYGFIVIDLP